MVVRGVGEEKVAAAEATAAAGVTVDQKPGVLGFDTSLRWQATKAFLLRLLGGFVCVDCLLGVFYDL